MALFKMKPRCGEHTMRDGRVLHPGDKIRCEAHQLGCAIDKFELIEDDPPPEITPPTLPDGWSLRPRGGGWYDVFLNVAGVNLRQNTVALRYEEAMDLIATRFKKGVPPGDTSNAQGGASDGEGDDDDTDSDDDETDDDGGDTDAGADTDDEDGDE